MSGRKTCSNPACSTTIVARMALAGGYLPPDLDAGLLRAAQGESFTRDRTGDVRAAPVQRDLFAS